MEIYKLKDEVPMVARKKSGARSSVAKPKITNLKQGLKNPNRVNVFVDGKFAFSLDVAQVVELNVKVGRELDAAELAEMKRASEFGKAYQRALEWVLVRPRSVKELRDYLRKRNVQNEMKERKKAWDAEREMADLIAKGEEVDAERIQKRLVRASKREGYDFDELIVERLRERGYVDDKKFAEWYVQNRFVKKGVSRKRLETELKGKGVEAEISEEVLGGRNEEEEIRKMIARKRGKYDNEKLTAYLCRQGFSYDLVSSLVGEEENS